MLQSLNTGASKETSSPLPQTCTTVGIRLRNAITVVRLSRRRYASRPRRRPWITISPISCGRLGSSNTRGSGVMWAAVCRSTGRCSSPAPEPAGEAPARAARRQHLVGHVLAQEADQRTAPGADARDGLLGILA